ncbi:peptidoglycan binding protein CsiV [Shewanella acanthi]|uniref:peptidoglycan binding protein CsiV n=1 Tax=Shewanella acanthi TaxID=2864212 RepID=UPI001C654F0A|nr:peptidoglycan binding protein CsiV [Shewanella acanthi]QYJ80317.1 peptidoglycan binding protein CsiV [Shewanella acanthi]
MLRQLAVSIASLIALSHSSIARAQTWFEVEVYVFERQTHSTEQWPMAPIATKTERALDLISPVVGQAISTVATEQPCTLIYDENANSRCAEGTGSSSSSSFGDQYAPSTASSTTYRYPASIPSTISGNGQNTSGAVLLSSNQGQFSSIISALSREPGNRSLLHMTWQQPMTSKSGSVPIRLFSGRDYSGRYSFDGRQLTQGQDTSTPISDGGVGQMQPNAPVWQLDGTINIYLNHYLYIETALNLRKEGRKMMSTQTDDMPTSYAGASSSTTVEPSKVMTPYLMSIPLEQNRRVKSDEIHYLDHPEMGMVIQIRKMAQPSM